MKFSICALFVVLALQGFANARQTNVVREEIIRGWIDDIIAQIKDKVQALIETAYEYITEAIEKIEKLGSILYEEVKEKVLEEINVIESTIDRLIKDAIDAGKDIQDCVDESSYEIDRLKQNVLANGTVCVNKAIDKALAVIDDAKNQLSALSQDATNLIEEAKECGLSFFCLAGVAAKIPTLVGEAQSLITDLIYQVTKLVENVQQETTACLAEVGEEALSGGFVIIKNITTCIENK